MENQKYFTLVEFGKDIRILNSKRVSQYSGIPTKIMKENLFFSDFSYTAMNNSIKYQFPSCFKAADVTPVYKRGEKITIGLLAFYR